ncbi:MAG: hypothetical protein IMZ66_11970, partial [Planctomycetes bacterium]|nr:hypothetical protein [Planctomycetota bacterium]
PRPAPVLAEVQTALVSLSRRTGTAEATVSAAIAEMPQVGAAGRASLLRVLGRLGGEKALGAVRGALKNEDAGIRDAAIRALAEWPDGAALGDLLGVARSATDVQAKVLALRGFARLASEASGLKAEQLAPLFAEAMPLAVRPEEKKVLLGAMAKVPCVETMRLAAGSLTDAALRDEAGLAVVQIAEAVWRYHVDEAKAAVRQVLEAAPAQAVKDRAAAIVVAMSKPVNLALGATASSPDDLDGDGDSRGDQAAIDGDPATYWDEVDGRQLYRLCVTLKAAVEVSAVSIVGFKQHNFAPKDFEVLCDGKAVKSVEGAAYDENRLIVTFAPVRCTTVELKITGYYGGSPAIRELEIYRVDPSAAK